MIALAPSLAGTTQAGQIAPMPAGQDSAPTTGSSVPGTAPVPTTGTVPLRDRLDRPLRDLRISLTDACNFRCVYCMPRELYGDAGAFLPEDRHLSFEDILAVCKAAVGLGVRKIKLTGGEPLLRPWVPHLVGELTRLEGLEDLGLITNGSLLKGLARHLWKAGLRRITVSLDALHGEVFNRMNGQSHGVDEVIRGIEAAWDCGFRPLKINTVLVKGKNEDQILPLVEFCRRPGMELRFIELMDTGTTVAWDPGKVVESGRVLDCIRSVWDLAALPSRTDGEVAQRFRHVDGQGEIGLISSISSPFCKDCNRLRITAEGKVHTCLFGPPRLDLAPLLARLASGEDRQEQLARALGGLWAKRQDRYSEKRLLFSGPQASRSEMNQLGG